jgi:F-type H+-transporting ATPase subunit b
MSFFLFDPAKKVLQNRQEKIKNELDEAQSSMEQAKALKEEYEAKLKISMLKKKQF